jgi:hypothetical protein
VSFAAITLCVTSQRVFVVVVVDFVIDSVRKRLNTPSYSGSLRDYKLLQATGLVAGISRYPKLQL